MRTLMVLFAVLTLATTAQATSLTGDDLTAAGTAFVLNPSPQTVTVGPGVEFGGGPLGTVDVGGDSSVRFDMTAGSLQNFGGAQFVTLSDFDWDYPSYIVGIDNLVVDRMAPAGSFGVFSVTSFTDDSVTFRFQGVWGVDSFASFDLVTAPEPSSFLLAGLGIVGLGLLGRRRRK